MTDDLLTYPSTIYTKLHNLKRFAFWIKLLKHISTTSLTQQQFFFSSPALWKLHHLKKNTSNAKQCTVDNTCSVKKQQQEEMLVRHSILNLNIILGLFGNTWKSYE